MAATTDASRDEALAAEPDDDGLPPYPPPRAWWRRVEGWAGLLVLAACCAFVVAQLDPALLLRNTTVVGGDNAAHTWWPAYLRDHLLPFRLAGWSPDFYAGFPAGQFYFPIPALSVVGLDLFVPYNVAFKLTTALGPVLMPIGAYVFAKGIRVPKPGPAAFAVAATAFVFFNGDPGTSKDAGDIAFNQHIMGGTLASTLAGEYSFSIALALALMFFGTLAWSLRTRRRMWLPALLLALTVMSHLVVAIFAVVGALVVWLGSRPIKNLRPAAAIGVVGALLTAVWTFPLLATLEYTTDMRYTPIACPPHPPAGMECTAAQNPVSYLFPTYVFGLNGAAPWDWVNGWEPWEWGGAVLIAAALIGMVVGRRRSTAMVLTLTAICGLLFRFWEDIQATPAWNLRFLPFWYLGVFLLMALGAVEIIRALAWGARKLAVDGRWPISPRVVRVSVATALTVVLSITALVRIDATKDFLPYWVRWNYRGAEDVTGQGTTQPKSYAEYRSFMDTVGSLPPGRLLWEGNSQLNAYGSPLALMLLPYFTDGRISSMEGVYYEASASTPYHFMTAAALASAGNASNAVRGVPYTTQAEFHTRGVPYLQLLGVRYLAVHSAEAKAAADADTRLRLVATVPDMDVKPPSGWSVYRVADSQVVTPLAYQPVVIDEPTAADERACARRMRKLVDPNDEGRRVEVHDWPDCVAVPWFDDPAALDRPLVADGPADWQHAQSRRARKLPKQPLPEVEVTDIRTDDDSVSFRVSRTGVPVYVKTSWFPNWEADGAEGPYRATPNFMVVVPTEKTVTLHYGTTSAEWLGRLGTLAGLVGLGALAAWPWWTRRRRAAAAKPEPVQVPAGAAPGRAPEAPEPGDSAAAAVPPGDGAPGEPDPATQ